MSSSSSSGSESSVLDTFKVIGKHMDEDGIIEWTIQWDSDGDVEKVDDFQLESAEGWKAMADFEATHIPSSTDLETVLPGICEQSPYAACSTISGLIVEVWEREKTSSAFKGVSFDNARPSLFKAFASMDSRLLSELKSGNVQRRKYIDRNFRLMLYSLFIEQLTDEKGKRPAQYLFEFTDQYGRPPTNVEGNRLLQFARRYLTDQQFAYEVDLQSDPDVVLKRAAYSSGWNRVTDGEQQRQNIVLEFIRLSQEYLDDWGVDKMLQAWRELGYTHDTDARIIAHGNQRSTNYLMVLMESISSKCCNGTWTNRGHLIYNCISRLDGEWMEVALSAISGANMSSGHGMSHYPAGRSNASAWYPRYISVWDHWEASALPMIRQNVTAEHVQLLREEKDRQALRGEVELEKLSVKSAKMTAEAELLRLEVAMARLHVAVRTEVPPVQGAFAGDAEVADSQSDSDVDMGGQ